MTTITIKIPDSINQTLRRQAEAAGKPIEQLVSEVLEAQVAPDKIILEISGSVHKKFLESGMTEDRGIAQRLEKEDHFARGIPYDDE